MQHTRLFAAAALAAAVAACSDVSEPVTSPDVNRPIARSASRAPEQVMPGEVVVKFKDGVDVQSAAAEHGLAFAAAGYHNAFAVLRGAVGNERAAAASLRGDSRVVYAEPNYLRQFNAINPNLWAFYNPGGLNMKYSSGKSAGQFLPASYASKADADMDNIEAYAAGGSDVIVGGIDTGVDLTHPEFTGRLIIGKDWYSNDNDPTDTDDHGSHTAGTMAGTTVGVAGVSGASPHVKIYVQRVCGQRGCPVSAIASAIRAAADAGVVAMNLSIGGSSESQSEKDAITYALGKGSLVVASAGNSSAGTVECPACDPNAISVASLTWSDALASYSNYGPGLDISAPGGNCYSNTTQEGCIYSSIRGGYGWMQGTSMASPQVAGTLAVVASVTGLRGAALRSRVESTADDLGTAGYDTKFGAGRVNTYRAVTGNTLAGGL